MALLLLLILWLYSSNLSFLLTALSEDSCHLDYHNLDVCIQFFPGLGYYDQESGHKVCLVTGGHLARYDEGDVNDIGMTLKEWLISEALKLQLFISSIPLAAWKLLKAIGREDLNNRRPPRLTKFHADKTKNEDKKAYLMFWPKTRLEGDYCESNNGYVCQRPAAAWEAPEGNGRLLK